MSKYNLINLTVNEQRLKRVVRRAKERGIVIPTFAQMKDPGLMPNAIKQKLKTVGLWDVNPLNLYRISWHNQPVEKGGLYGGVNYIVLPQEITGVKAKIVALSGKWFPTGAHKVMRVRLPRTKARNRSVRPHNAESRLAVHRKLLPRRRLRLGAAGL
jgi:cysteine synthase A